MDVSNRPDILTHTATQPARANANQAAGAPLLSIVIPSYNEEVSLKLLRERIDKVLSNLDIAAEVILVDDGSSDRSAEIMREFAQSDSRYKAMILSRNYGHQIALTAGLDYASGDTVVVLDADLQDPPELIPQMLAKWREGYHVVYGKRTSREGDSLAKRLTASLFYRLIRILSDVDIPTDVGDFRLMDRAVVEALKRMPERFRFIRGMVTWTGFKQYPLCFDRAPRAAGTTKYPWRGMARFALDAIFSFSMVPLRLASILGLMVIIPAMALILRTLYLRFIFHAIIPGFTALYVGILFLGGLNLLLLGVIGEYIGRIYVETKRRPLYFVQELIAQRVPGN